jgi:hypothetical protein
MVTKRSFIVRLVISNIAMMEAERGALLLLANTGDMSNSQTEQTINNPMLWPLRISGMCRRTNALLER